MNAFVSPFFSSRALSLTDERLCRAVSKPPPMYSPHCRAHLRMSAAESSPNVALSGSASKGDIADLKAALYAAVAGLDLGRAVLDDEAAQEDVEVHIRKLEALNPTPDPADDPLRRARWKLVYTTSPIVLGRDRPGFGRPEKCWQVLDMRDGEAGGCVRNEEEGAIRFLGLELRWRNQIVGVCKALRGERIRLKFEKFTLGNAISVKFPGPVVGWQDQTFLDDTLRIARTQYGNVFVLENDGSC